MISAILSCTEMFRAERLFTDRVSSPIPNNPFHKSENALLKRNKDNAVFNKSISRSLKNITKYRVVEI
jgi:hypothetical protein